MTSLSDFRCALQNLEFPNGISHIRCHRTVFPSGKFGISVIPTTGEHHISLYCRFGIQFNEFNNSFHHMYFAGENANKTTTI